MNLKNQMTVVHVKHITEGLTPIRQKIGAEKSKNPGNKPQDRFRISFDAEIAHTTENTAKSATEQPCDDNLEQH